ncbi:MAG TPA: SDR family NAD(P)-dependent oxidoreductase [Gemmatimonadales bacterium]|jgi:3-oxoacyl-[acyl-carrier protein] reductase
MNLTGSLCVVTGGTEGIGRSIAFAFGRAGARLAICARTAARVEATVAELRAAGCDAIGRQCDVGDDRSVAGFAEFVATECGDTVVLVNNAGIGRFAPLAELSLADWDLTMATNLRSLFLVTRALLPAVVRSRGAIVNIASLAGKNGFEGGTAYCASKHAVLGFSKSLMLEVRKQGVRVIAVCPGSVATPFMDKQTRMHPNREKVLQPDDVAQAVVAALALPDHAMVSELDLRPTNP